MHTKTKSKKDLRTNTISIFLLLIMTALASCAKQPPDEEDTDIYDTAGGGCAEASGEAAHPFGNHEQTYVSGSVLPDQYSTQELDNAVRTTYDEWKNHYLKDDCGDDTYYISIGSSESLTVSEAHGYGMIILAYMAGHEPDARDYFDGMVRYFKDHPSNNSNSLMAWSQDQECSNNQGGSSATDGDLDIAYALLLADKQWGSDGDIEYINEALNVMSGILQHEIDDSHSYILMGDWTSPYDDYYYDATRSSDFMPGHFFSFEEATSDDSWIHVADQSYEMLATVRDEYAPNTGLFPDFIQYPMTSPTPAESNFLERPVDGEYSYNACRVPFRVGVHYLTSGDSRARDFSTKISDWIKSKTNNNPENISAGYYLDGNGLPNSQYESQAFIAPFGVAAMADSSNQEWLNNMWDFVANDTENWGYYEDTIKLLSMIVMSGNWWAPEDAPCP